MNPLPEARGLALLCDPAGNVVRVLRDDLGLAARMPPGSPLADLADPEVREKVGRFIAELRERQAAYDWEITVSVDGELHLLHFAGAQIAEGLLVVGACSRHGMAQMSDEMMQINNEQANAQRATAKDLSLATGHRRERDDAQYDELTQVNNELANLHRELARTNAELAKLNEQKNRFVGMAAHDLRSPLGVILTYSEFLEIEAGPVLSEEQREFVSTIKTTSEFMLRLVSDLLDVSSIESGQLTLDLRPVDLAELVRRHVALNRVLATPKAIAVECEPPSALPTVLADAGKLEQVLNNLIGNAVKFSHRDTRVIARVTSADGFATVAVQDQGQGIPAAELPRLFKVFGKSSVRSTAGEPSTGLGLAICRRIIESHGGRIGVESTVGRGSTFFFTLPLAVAPGGAVET